MEKRGDISIGVIVGIIIAIVGFGILLLVYYQLNWTGTIDREVCHQSVVYRGTLPILAKDYVPLKCQTQKICITSKVFGTGGCEEFKNEKGIEYFRVSEGERGLRQIEKTYADSILDCWSMMGEGKVNIFSNFLLERYGVGGVAPSCVICSRIAIDKASFKNTDFSQLNVINYMQSHYVPNKDKNYVQYMSGGQYNSALSIQANQLSIPAVEEYDDKGNKLVDVFNLDDLPDREIGDANLKETAVMFMQITGPPSNLESATNVLKDAGIIAGTSFVIAPRKTFQIATGIANGGWLSLAVLVIAGVYQQGSVLYNKGVTAGYCGDVTLNGKEAQKSCSVVRTVNYDVSEIVKYCPNIESIP